MDKTKTCPWWFTVVRLVNNSNSASNMMNSRYRSNNLQMCCFWRHPGPSTSCADQKLRAKNGGHDMVGEWWMLRSSADLWSMFETFLEWMVGKGDVRCRWRCGGVCIFIYIYILIYRNYIYIYIYIVPYMGGTPIAWRFAMDNPIKMDDFEVPPFMETPVYMVSRCILLEFSVFAHCSWKRANAGIYMAHCRCQALKIQCPQLQDPSPSRFG